MDQLVSRNGRVPNVAGIEWDYVSGLGCECPVCKQIWRDAPDVLVSRDERIAVVDGAAFYVTDAQARVLEVLRFAFGRWLSPELLLQQAYSDTSDADVPDDIGVITTAISVLRRRLGGTKYYIETRREVGYRFYKTEPGTKKHGTHRSDLYKPSTGRRGKSTRRNATASTGRNSRPRNRGTGGGRKAQKRDQKRNRKARD